MNENAIIATDPLGSLLDVLRLARDAEHRFTGECPDPTGLRIFGGQLGAQAVMAAAPSVPEGHRLTSLHCTFVRMGDPAQPVDFEVEATGGGRTFSFRRVVARQGDRLILTASATFHAGGEGPGHEWPAVARPVPGRMATYEPGIPVMVTDAFEMRRQLDPVGTAERGMDLALRAVGPLPDDPHLHAALAVYVSDMFILDASLLPHQDEPVVFTDYNVATVDHALQLHAPVRLDDWVVNRFESPRGGGGLSEVRCEMRTADGVRVASGLQQGLLIDHRP